MAESLASKYQQITEAIQGINSVVTRIDERVEIFTNKLYAVERKVDHHVENCPVKCAFSELSGRVKVLESKNGNSIKQEMKETIKDAGVQMGLQVSEIKKDLELLDKEIDVLKLTTKDLDYISSSAAQKWKTTGTIAFNILIPLIYILIGAVLLKALGLASLPVP